MIISGDPHGIIYQYLAGGTMGVSWDHDRYPLVNKHSYGKRSFIIDFPIENDDFLWLAVLVIARRYKFHKIP